VEILAIAAYLHLNLVYLTSHSSHSGIWWHWWWTWFHVWQCAARGRVKTRGFWTGDWQNTSLVGGLFLVIVSSESFSSKSCFNKFILYFTKRDNFPLTVNTSRVTCFFKTCKRLLCYASNSCLTSLQLSTHSSFSCQLVDFSCTKNNY